MSGQKKDSIIRVHQISKHYGTGEVLNDISLTVCRGESVGIIGRNGAGKSTFLKILAGVVKPTKGTVEICGSVTSILDVGTGFHPELSGRDNVVLVSSLLGFGKKEIAKRMDEIIAFSELKEAIDQPVKNYSNGMYLRLAFSIYSVMNTDILLLDEVLSVGDAAFKRKSLQVIQEFKKRGKTIVLVSHNFNDIINYCDRVVYLDGVLKADSPNHQEVINRYLGDYPGVQKIFDPSWNYMDKKAALHQNGEPGNPAFQTVRNEVFEMLNVEYKTGGVAKKVFNNDEPIDICFNYHKKTNTGALQLTVKIFDFNDTMLLADSAAFNKEYEMGEEPEGEYILTMKIPARFFNAGRFYITMIIAENKILKGTWHNISAFEVQLDPWMKSQIWASIPSPLLPRFRWELQAAGQNPA